MEIKKYFSIPAVSNSVIRYFQISPNYCWKRMNNEIIDEEKSYTYLGKQSHMYILESEEFEKNYTYLDFKTPTSKQQQTFCEDYIKYTKTESALDIEDEKFLSHEASLVYAYQDNYTADKKSAESILKSAKILFEINSEYIKYLSIKGDYREVLSKSRQELLTTITQAIRKHKKANALIFEDQVSSRTQTFNELPVYWDFPIVIEGTALKCKSLLDRLIVDHEKKVVTLVDLKTTSVIGSQVSTLEERQYYRQLAFYMLAVKNIKEIPNDYKIEAYIVFVNTVDPFECKVYKLSDVEFQRQIIIITNLLTEISWHWFTNKWEYSRAYYEGDGTENL